MAFGVRAKAATARADAFDDAGLGQLGDTGDFPELDCVRDLIAADALDDAGQRAAAIGVGADRVLIGFGALSEEVYLRTLGKSLGVAFEPLDSVPRSQCPIDAERLIEAAAASLLPLAADDDLAVVVAPRGTAARQILRLIDENPGRARRFRFTTAERLNRFVLRYAGKRLAMRASDRLNEKWPMLSAAPPRWRGSVVPVAMLAILSLAAAAFAPTATMLVFEVMLAAVFLAWLGLRLAGVFVRASPRDAACALSDATLPVYTVISALYREAASVNGLLSAIERLDYPGIMAQMPHGRSPCLGTSLTNLC